MQTPHTVLPARQTPQVFEPYGCTRLFGFWFVTANTHKNGDPSWALTVMSLPVQRREVHRRHSHQLPARSVLHKCCSGLDIGVRRTLSRAHTFTHRDCLCRQPPSSFHNHVKSNLRPLPDSARVHCKPHARVMTPSTHARDFKKSTSQGLRRITAPSMLSTQSPADPAQHTPALT